MHAAHHKDIGSCLFCYLSQSQAVTYEIGNILYITVCIIMCKHHCILLLTQAADSSLEIHIRRDSLIDISLINPFLLNHNYYIY